MKTLWGLLMLLLAFSATIDAAGGRSDNEIRQIDRGIEKSVRAMSAAIAREDIDTFLQYFTDDFVLYDLGHPVCRGGEQHREQVRYAVDLGVRHFERDLHEIDGDLETALEIGEATVYSDNWDPISQYRYMTIWKNEDGVWKIHRTVSNK